MSGPVESTYQGYIASTHDALLIFECVRRGVLPKVKRRLRDDERKLIRSGQVFVFDEKESGIKRWTDGLLWSPSRILWNFLVYRQVEKRQPNNKPQLYQAHLPSQAYTLDRSFIEGGIDLSQPGPSRHQYAPSGQFSAFPSRPHVASASVLEQPGSRSYAQSSSSSQSPAQNRLRSVSAADSSYQVWQSMSYVDIAEGKSGLSPSNNRDTNMERDLVGSLTTSYPFAKDGLCKKTISIQTENSTQHLISYYSLQDVRSGRLRTPSSLPEIASLAIAPIFLTKTTFRFPPVVAIGPDGVPRFRSDETQELPLHRYEGDSSGEGTSSGSDANSRMNRVVSLQEVRQYPYHSGIGASRSSSALGGMPTLSSSHPAYPLSPNTDLRQLPMSHEYSGAHSALVSRSRGMSDVASRGSSAIRSRYEPYTLQHNNVSPGRVAAANFARPRAATASISSMSTSPSSTPSTPFVNLPTGMAAAFQNVAHQTQSAGQEPQDRLQSRPTVVPQYSGVDASVARQSGAAAQGMPSPFASIVQDLSQPYDTQDPQFGPVDQSLLIPAEIASQQQQQPSYRQGATNATLGYTPSEMQSLAPASQHLVDNASRRPYTSAVDHRVPANQRGFAAEHVSQQGRPSSSESFIYRQVKVEPADNSQLYVADAAPLQGQSALGAHAQVFSQAAIPAAPAWQSSPSIGSWLVPGGELHAGQHYASQISGLPGLPSEPMSQPTASQQMHYSENTQDNAMYSQQHPTRSSPPMAGGPALAASMFGIPSPKVASSLQPARPKSSSHRRSPSKASSTSMTYTPNNMGSVYLARPPND